MTDILLSEPVEGYLLLPPDRESPYRGVDRNPFQPLLIDSEIILPNQGISGRRAVWQFYPPGWRRDAYRLIEEHSAQCDLLDCDLISDYNVALAVRQIILGPVGEHEIMKVSLVDLNHVQVFTTRPVDQLVGYDAAYPGGDWYSAIRNSLACDLSTAQDRWLIPYHSMLNQYRLFREPLVLPDFISSFRAHVLSEADSHFVGIELSVPEKKYA